MERSGVKNPDNLRLAIAAVTFWILPLHSVQGQNDSFNFHYKHLLIGFKDTFILRHLRTG
jgi:hypothetical protein